MNRHDFGVHVALRWAQGRCRSRRGQQEGALDHVLWRCRAKQGWRLRWVSTLACSVVGLSLKASLVGGVRMVCPGRTRYMFNKDRQLFMLVVDHMLMQCCTLRVHP